MATYEELMGAARKAHEAGDKAATKRFLELARESQGYVKAENPPESLGAIALDAGRATLSGIGEGVMGLATLPSTLGGLMDAGFERLTGIDPNPAGGLPSAGQLANRAYQEGVAYEPQTTLGEYGRTVGNYLPGIALGGTLTQMIAAGIASEGAGQATEGTKWEPWARALGGIAGGIGAQAISNKTAKGSAVRKYIKDNSQTKPLRDEAKRLYEEGHNLGLKLKPAATSQLNQKLRVVANDEGLITPTGKIIENANVRQVFDLLDDFQSGSITTKQAMAVRKQINALAGSNDPALSRVGVLFKREYDSWIDQFAPQFKQANELNRRAMLGDMMDKMEDLAEDRAAQFSQSGIDNAMRTEFSQLNKRIIRGKEKGLRPDQIEAVKAASQGTTASNSARMVGKMAPRGAITFGLTGAPAAVGALAGSPMLGLAASGLMAGTGIAGQGLASLMRMRLAQQAAAAMRAPAPLALPPSQMPLSGLAAMTAANPRGR